MHANVDIPTRIIRKTQQINLDDYKTKQVAAYARVSSNKDMAIHSLNAQVKYYMDYIANHTGWKAAGIYVDEGVSGTKETRPQFQQMLEDARAGMIDIILTKSITRFARNTVVLLDTVRELNGLGVDVYFEKENVHTSSATGEIMITVLATFAEEEARSASLNQLWRIKRMFENGRPTYTKMLGYRMVDGKLQIVPEEAEIVRKIYRYYLDGMGYERIVRLLEAEGIKSLTGKPFNTKRIRCILSNEKYAGNLMLQKTYREDFRTKKDALNNGKKPKYFIEDTHEAIIDKQTWNTVQKERQRRRALMDENALRGMAKDSAESNARNDARSDDENNIKNGNKNTIKHDINNPNLFTGLVVCSVCGKHFNRKLRNGKYNWLCRTYTMYGKEACQNNGIPEDILESKTKEAFGAILPNIDTDKITRDLLLKNLKDITVPERKKLIFNFRNGESYCTEWDYKSRRKSWTPEMKEKARQKAKSRNENNNKSKTNKTRKEAK